MSAHIICCSHCRALPGAPRASPHPDPQPFPRSHPPPYVMSQPPCLQHTQIHIGNNKIAYTWPFMATHENAAFESCASELFPCRCLHAFRQHHPPPAPLTDLLPHPHRAPLDALPSHPPGHPLVSVRLAYRLSASEASRTHAF